MTGLLGEVSLSQCVLWSLFNTHSPNFRDRLCSNIHKSKKDRERICGQKWIWGLSGPTLTHDLRSCCSSGLRDILNSLALTCSKEHGLCLGQWAHSWTGICSYSDLSLKETYQAKPGSCVTGLWRTLLWRVCTSLRISDGFVPILRKRRDIMGWQND